MELGALYSLRLHTGFRITTPVLADDYCGVNFYYCSLWPSNHAAVCTIRACDLAARSSSYDSSAGTMTFAFLAYARCTALLLCPSDSCANRSGIPALLARSAHA